MVRSSLLLCGLVLTAAPVLAQEAERAGSPLLRFLFAWAPFIVIIGIWLWFMRGFGGGGMGKRFRRSLEHMDRVEEHMERLEGQNQQMIETLQKVERQLRR